jgi:hypothetical protein
MFETLSSDAPVCLDCTSLQVYKSTPVHLRDEVDELQETSYKFTPETSYKSTPVRVTNRPSAYSNPKSTDEVRVSGFASTEK